MPQYHSVTLTGAVTAGNNSSAIPLSPGTTYELNGKAAAGCYVLVKLGPSGSEATLAVWDPITGPMRVRARDAQASMVLTPTAANLTQCSVSMIS